jgi:hypothetical protein
MIPLLLNQRQYGLPLAQKRLQEAYDDKTADLARDIFSHTTIELPRGFEYTFLRNGDLVAVISTSQARPKVQRLALWSLLKRCKVSDIEIARSPNLMYTDKCEISSSGMVLISPIPGIGELYKLVFQDWITVLTHNKRDSHHLNGRRVFISWTEEPGIEPVSLFGEFDYSDGRCIWYKRLSDPIQQRNDHVYAHSEEYWVRLSGSKKSHFPSLIEVVDIKQRSPKAFELPLNNNKIAFTCGCIVQNLLFYGKYETPTNSNSQIVIKPTLGIFDLDQGVVVAEYPTKGNAPKKIMANEHFVAWSEYREINIVVIKYLNLNTKKIATATISLPMSYHINLDLNLSGSLLTFSYPTGGLTLGQPLAHWHREVINLTTGVKIQDVKYKRHSHGTCSYNNGIFFLADTHNVQTKMYIESFIQDDNIQEKSEFRA